MPLHIHFRLSTSHGQFPVEELLAKVPELVDYYLGAERLTCCSFQAGYCIDVDGKRWNGDDDGYEFDEPWMTSHWLNGLNILLGSSSKIERVGFWEQSEATIKRIDQDVLEIEDPAAHAGAGSCAPTCVNAHEFAEQMVLATRKYLELCSLIEAELERRGDAVPQEKKEKITNELYAEVFRQKLQELEEVRS